MQRMAQIPQFTLNLDCCALADKFGVKHITTKRMKYYIEQFIFDLTHRLD